MIEWRYNLPPLSPRDASNQVANLALALNFQAPYSPPPVLPIVRSPIPTLCGLFELGSEIDNESYDFLKLLVSNLASGWKTLGL
jgi:phospholipase C